MGLEKAVLLRKDPIVDLFQPPSLLCVLSASMHDRGMRWGI
jgi:hypothetical protein